ncbi:hypothetical protein JYG23_12390 [Sedimentibacter sp. zth1]|uniref:SAF domain-containing protein n=1 Tax=Sedimentibacter sp. zth1 TaxID=2816908 RepID=UPI001A91B42A|nr:SAF domain-containing protein [Sedimentibacter sp. zth1]QSX05467.1 hypothetical protein JYG23_12390 [Sedimentibacter sp. zth1]
MKAKHKTLIGTLLLLLAIAFFIFWEFIGRKTVMCQNIIILSQDVDKGTLITEELLTTKKIETESCITDVVVSKSVIVGLEAKHYIPKHTQLVKQYFEESALVLTKDEKIMKIPKDWIYTFPETLRRKDKIYIYAVKKDETTTKVTNYKDNKEQYIFSTTVAYVKDSSNREVESLDEDRLTGTSVISDIEIVITEKQFKMLEDLTSKGFTLAIMYK